MGLVTRAENYWPCRAPVNEGSAEMSLGAADRVSAPRLPGGLAYFDFSHKSKN